MQAQQLDILEQNIKFAIDELVKERRQYINKHVQNSLNNYFLENYCVLELKQCFEIHSGRQIKNAILEKYSMVTYYKNLDLTFTSEQASILKKYYISMLGFLEEHLINGTLETYRDEMLKILIDDGIPPPEQNLCNQNKINQFNSSWTEKNDQLGEYQNQLLQENQSQTNQIDSQHNQNNNAENNETQNNQQIKNSNTQNSECNFSNNNSTFTSPQDVKWINPYTLYGNNKDKMKQWAQGQWKRLIALFVLHHSYFPAKEAIYQIWFDIFQNHIVDTKTQKKKKPENYRRYKYCDLPYICNNDYYSNHPLKIIPQTYITKKIRNKQQKSQMKYQSSSLIGNDQIGVSAEDKQQNDSYKNSNLQNNGAILQDYDQKQQPLQKIIKEKQMFTEKNNNFNSMQSPDIERQSEKNKQSQKKNKKIIQESETQINNHIEVIEKQSKKKLKVDAEFLNINNNSDKDTQSEVSTTYHNTKVNKKVKFLQQSPQVIRLSIQQSDHESIRNESSCSISKDFIPQQPQSAFQKYNKLKKNTDDIQANQNNVIRMKQINDKNIPKSIEIKIETKLEANPLNQNTQDYPIILQKQEENQYCYQNQSNTIEKIDKNNNSNNDNIFKKNSFEEQQKEQSQQKSFLQQQYYHQSGQQQQKQSQQSHSSQQQQQQYNTIQQNLQKQIQQENQEQYGYDSSQNAQNPTSQNLNSNMNNQNVPSYPNNQKQNPLIIFQQQTQQYMNQFMSQQQMAPIINFQMQPQSIFPFMKGYSIVHVPVICPNELLQQNHGLFGQQMPMMNMNQFEFN